MYLSSIYFSLNSFSDAMIEMYMHSSVSNVIVVGILFNRISIIPNFLGYLMFNNTSENCPLLKS